MRTILWTAPTRRIDALPVTVTSTDSLLVGALCQKIADGLELLRGHYPRGYRSVCREIQRIAVVPGRRAKGEWYGPLGLCLFSLPHLAADATTADVACTLVHEATHGRLERLGFRSTPARRVRVEVICTRAEIAFVEMLPESGLLQSELAQTLGRLEVLYSDANLHYGRIHSLRELGAPGWLLRVVDRLYRSRAA